MATRGFPGLGAIGLNKNTLALRFSNGTTTNIQLSIFLLISFILMLCGLKDLISNPGA